jgi:hypothetical protein
MKLNGCLLFLIFMKALDTYSSILMAYALLIDYHLQIECGTN